MARKRYAAQKIIGKLRDTGVARDACAPSGVQVRGSGVTLGSNLCGIVRRSREFAWLRGWAMTGCVSWFRCVEAALTS